MTANTNGPLRLAVTLAVGLLTAACAAPATTLPSSSPTVSPTVAGSPRPTRTPIPSLAEGMTRFKGTVTDATTGKPLEDVCVIIGPPVDCQENFVHSDEKGLWLVDLPVGGGGLSWTFSFSKPGYALTAKMATSSAPGEQIIDVQLPAK